MPEGFSQLSSPFIGRDDTIKRFNARWGHFRFFIYEGLPGVGKTWLMLRLAEEANKQGLSQLFYLGLWPGETVASLLARVEARLGASTRSFVETQGDPYGRLIDVLNQHKSILVLDSVQNLKREDLLALIRSAQSRPGDYVIISGARGDTQLSAMDRAAIHFERLGPFTPQESLDFARQHGLKDDAKDAFILDAKRKGGVCHAMTSRLVLSLYEGRLPASQLMSRLTSRSVQSFKMAMDEAIKSDRLTEAELKAVRTFAAIGVPLTEDIARKAMGSGLAGLLEKGLVDTLAGELHLHYLAQQYFFKSYKIEAQTAKHVAQYLSTDGQKKAEPMMVLRAAELLAHSVGGEEAINVLTHGWETARDYGFFEAYLKSVAAIPRGSDDTVDTRLKLLAARARMRQGQVSKTLRQELEALSQHRDVWTKSRALAALTYVYSQSREPDEVLKSYDGLKKSDPEESLLMESGGRAAEAMVRVGQVDKAESLAHDLLSFLKGRKRPGHEGEMHRLLARVYAEAGNLKAATKEAKAAAKCFEKAGDLYHSAAAYGYLGDLYRESGDFELARECFAQFRDQAAEWGDRDLMQIAELSDAWVALDTGDLATAAKRIDAVVKELSAAASKRLKRYLAAARALLDAGRGQHAAAANALTRVVESWDAAGQTTIADVLRAQLVRSLIACGELEEANQIVDQALERLDAGKHAPRVATFLRERALICLRRKDLKSGMAELSRARSLFAQGGNRREEALTLFRIAHAALDDNDLDVAKQSASELSTLAVRMQHTRAIALARELEGKIALLENDGKEAAAKLKEAVQALKKLGDAAGTLHVSEALMRAMLVAGDYAGALKLGPRVRDQAEEMEIRDVRVRVIVMTGVALLQKGELENVQRYFRELPDKVVSPKTAALMWRFGEALGAVQSDQARVQKSRTNWTRQVRRMNSNEQSLTLQMLEQLALPPRERYRLIVGKTESTVGTEHAAWMRADETDVLFNFAENRFFDGGKQLPIKAAEQVRLLKELSLNHGKVVTFARAYEAAVGKPGSDKNEKHVKKVATLVAEIRKHCKEAQHLDLQDTAKGYKMVFPANHAVLVATVDNENVLSTHQQTIVKMLRQFALVPAARIEEACEITKAEAKKELTPLIKEGVIEAIRAGRGQAFRLT